MISQSFDAAFTRVKELVATFKEHERDFHHPSYSEADVRKDFIDKYWIAFGWDVNHEQQKNPYEQEVKVERSIDVEGGKKKADYAFLAPNFRDVRFFVEAKKPARNIDNADDYFQTIRYGWNAQTPVSILMDFEQFRVLDCRLKPNIKSAHDRALKKYHYTDYADPQKFAEIYYLFSREAAHGGALEKFAAALPKLTSRAAKRRLFAEAYKPVDEEFLQELDEMREELARSFKNRNLQLNGEELTEATQRTLDRLVFMRFLEDKLIEPEPIVERLGDGGSGWGDFVAESERLNRIFNGIIFKPHFLDKPDFVVDEKVFASVCERLAHTNTVYNFNYIPIHVLGSIYERFLGKVIVTTDKRARVEPKPEVRKAGGVYYTPEYIVRYIVAKTIGKLIDGKKPEEIAEMRFADIACGSGSFLLGVFDELLRYHTAYYNRNQTNRDEGVRAGCVENRYGSLRLSLKQKKAILKNNIYGVDLDMQAVEVAQFSLFLKLMDDETTASVQVYQQETKAPLLPSLSSNVVHGNSLINWDFDSGFFGSDDDTKIFPLDFTQVFSEVMRRGGFDAIVGNPPYVRIQGFPRLQIDYFSKTYAAAKGNYDLYVNFIEKGYKLLKPSGKLGLIVPNKFLKTGYGSGLRKYLSGESALEEIVDFGASQVFEATTYTCLLFLAKEPLASHQYAQAEAKAESLVRVTFDTFSSNMLDERAWLFMRERSQTLLSKMALRTTRLLDLPAEMNRGSSTGDDETFLIENTELEEEILRTPIFASDFSRYHFQPRNKWRVIFPYHVDEQMSRLIPEEELKFKSPKTYEYLCSHRKRLEERKQFKQWYGFSAPRSLVQHNSAQIIVPLLANRGLFAFLPLDEREQLCLMASGGFTITISQSCSLDPKFVLGLLNSKLLFWRLQQASNVFRGGWITCTKQYFGELPIRTINFSDKADRARYDHTVALVEAMLEAKRKLQAARTDRDRNFYENKCAALDLQIDNLIYELYGLNDDEIKIVEGGAPLI
jgi:type I restriction-modification system DNA methylase subunit